MLPQEYGEDMTAEEVETSNTPDNLDNPEENGSALCTYQALDFLETARKRKLTSRIWGVRVVGPSLLHNSYFIPTCV